MLLGIEDVGEPLMNSCSRRLVRFGCFERFGSVTVVFGGGFREDFSTEAFHGSVPVSVLFVSVQDQSKFINSVIDFVAARVKTVTLVSIGVHHSTNISAHCLFGILLVIVDVDESKKT